MLMDENIKKTNDVKIDDSSFEIYLNNTSLFQKQIENNTGFLNSRWELIQVRVSFSNSFRIDTNRTLNSLRKNP